ncbi:unnamed protein product [Paramecium primaurelia]|uniref:Transmembrane protein n=1 Tax=Paramecium primaurelia TaxID=5886 RepID=A0A8S1M8B5_PARPR|nr:unnamed protein product [Paramecium primaurelia]
MNRKIIAIFFIILTLQGNQAKEDFKQSNKCLDFDKLKIFACIKNQLRTAITYQSVTTFGSFIIAKIGIWLAGFSATGPVAGSLAAWIQSLIGKVAVGSFFSFLQAVAMGKSFLLIIPCLTIGTIAAIIYLVLNCFRSEYCILQELPQKSEIQNEQGQSTNQTSKEQRNQQTEQNQNEQEESFWSSSMKIIQSGISNTYSTITNEISEISTYTSTQLPNVPKELIEMKNSVLEYSSNYFNFYDSISEIKDNILEFSNKIASSIQEQLKENTNNMQNIFNNLTTTFGDYVNGINDLFEFIWQHRETIKEAFEYAIEVLKEQYDQFLNTQNFIENMRYSKEENTCVNNFIEYLANT